MPDITALRERAIALVERRRAIADGLAVLDGISLVLTPAMMAHTMPREWDADAEEDDERLRGSEGGCHPLFSHPALLAIIGEGDFTDRNNRTFANNTVYYVKHLRAACADLPDVSRGPEPDLSSLTRFEVAALVGAYRDAVESSTRILMLANESVERLREQRSRLPDYVRGACTGLFGQPDFPTAHAYAEGDFARYNRREVPYRPTDAGFMEGRTLTRIVDDHPQVFSARYLAPFLGDAAAGEVERALDAIEEATRPRAGEPRLGRFRSHGDTVAVDIAYAPGEIDIDGTPPLPSP
jgi:hypothetical protein